MYNIRLEVFKLGDEAGMKFLFDTRRHPAVCKWLIGNPPPDLETHKKWLEENVPNKRMVCILKQEDIHLGYCHAYNYNEANRTLEAGFVVHPEHQNKGFGKIMVTAFMIVLSMERAGWTVMLRVKENNAAALKIYLQQGFVQVSQGSGIITLERKL